MSGRFRPYRRLRSELLPLGFAVVAPAFLFAVFPKEALRPLAPAPSVKTPHYAFVVLSEAEERAVLANARAAWQLDRGATQRRRVDLFEAVLPAAAPRPVLDIATRRRVDRGAIGPYVPDVVVQSLVASPPARLPPQKGADAPRAAFSREELLKLN